MEGFVYDDTSGISSEPVEQSGGSHDDDSAPSEPGWKIIVVAILVVVAGLAALWGYAQHWKKNVWVREVVFSGNQLLSGDELLRKTEGLLGKSIEDIDDAALAERIVSLPYVRSAEVVKELSGIIRVRVEERVPIARLVSGDKVQVIDTEGYILPYRDLPPSSSPLLQVTGGTTVRVQGERMEKTDDRGFSVLKEMIEAVAASEYAHLLIRDVVLRKEDKTYFTAAASPTRFIVGNGGGYKEKLKKFEIFWQKVVAKKGLDGYATVDLRFTRRVFAVESNRQGFHRVEP